MAVRHQLARLSARTGDTQSVNHIVQTSFKQHQKIGTRQANLPLRTFEIAAELALHDAVNAARLLLFSKLQQVVGCPTSPELFLPSMLAGRI
jgi:hypothetical protein